MPDSGAMRLLAALLVLVVLLAWVKPVSADIAADSRVADVVKTGRLRVALFPPQYRKDPATGEIRRNVVYMEMARELAARLRIDLAVIDYTAPTDAMDALNAGACDLAFLAIDPARSAKVGFSPPFTQFDFTYLVPPDSSIRVAGDVDRPGVRIAAVRDHGSTLALMRVVKHAQVVAADVPDTAFDLLRSGRADAFAAPRVGLNRYASQLPGSRVLEDRYGAVLNAVAVAKERPQWLAYITEFVEQAKASGLVQRAIDRAGEPGVQVAPAAELPHAVGGAPRRN
jgi:polar amino acid transport system substrate-binding protein